MHLLFLYIINSGDVIDALLQEQQREDFIAMNARTTTMLQRAQPKLPTLTPIEDLSQKRSSETLAFNYTPIERCWEENFAINKAKWEKQLEKKKSLITINESSESAATVQTGSNSNHTTDVSADVLMTTINESSESLASGNHTADVSAGFSIMTITESTESYVSSANHSADV